MLNRHTIHRATIDLQLPDSGQADTRSVNEWCRSILLEELDVTLSEICPENQIVVLPAIQLNLTLIDWNEPLRSDSKNALRQQIRKQLSEQTQTSVTRMSRDAYQAEIVLRYLENGATPEIYTEPEWNALTSAFQEASQQNRPFLEKLLRVLANEAAFWRWLSVTDERFRYVWLDEQLPVSAGSWEIILPRWQKRLVRQWPDRFISVPQLLQPIIQLLAQEIREPETVLRIATSQLLRIGTAENATLVGPADASVTDSVDQWLIQVFSVLASQSTDIAETSQLIFSKTDLEKIQSSPSEIRSPKTLAVPIAGLVLIASWLPAFLREIELIDVENKLINAQRIPVLLYFIATGETTADEWQLVLPKLLCGLPIAESCDTSIMVSEREREEVDRLLTSVIDQWGKLKNTTPDGLRATFLQRSGRLTEKDAMYVLSIPEQTVDILLSFIPWSFRYVRFSWMQKLLIAEWGG